MEIKTSQARDITRKAIGYAVAKHRDKIVALLKKYGVAMDTSNSDHELIVAVLVTLRDKPRFKADLVEVLKGTTSDALSFTAEYNSFFFTGDSGKFFNTIGDGTVCDPASQAYADYVTNNGTPPPNCGSGSTSSGGGKTAVGQVLSDPKVLGGVLTAGLGILSTSLTNKGNQQLADTALAVETEKTKQAALLAAGTGGTGVAKPGMSMGAKIAIGVGVAAVLGLIAYLIFKKPGTPAPAPAAS